MNLQSTWTFGHQVSKNTYIGSTNTEGLAIGQKVSENVKTQVDVGDSVVVTDLDSSKGLGLNLRDLPSGMHLEVSNKQGEFETSTLIPINVDSSQLERGSDLNSNPNFQNVEKVTVQQYDDTTYISLKDQHELGERGIMVRDGKLTYMLRGA